MPNRITPSALYRELESMSNRVAHGVYDPDTILEVLDAVALDIALGATPPAAFAAALEAFGLSTAGRETPGLDLLGGTELGERKERRAPRRSNASSSRSKPREKDAGR